MCVSWSVPSFHQVLKVAFPVQQWQPDARFSFANFQPIAAFLICPSACSVTSTVIFHTNIISALVNQLSQRVSASIDAAAGAPDISRPAHEKEKLKTAGHFLRELPLLCVCCRREIFVYAGKHFSRRKISMNSPAGHRRAAQAPRHLGAGKCALGAIFSNYTARAARNIINICTRTRATARIRGFGADKPV